MEDALPLPSNNGIEDEKYLLSTFDTETNHWFLYKRRTWAFFIAAAGVLWPVIYGLSTLAWTWVLPFMGAGTMAMMATGILPAISIFIIAYWFAYSPNNWETARVAFFGGFVFTVMIALTYFHILTPALFGLGGSPIALVLSVTMMAIAITFLADLILTRLFYHNSDNKAYHERDETTSVNKKKLRWRYELKKTARIFAILGLTIFVSVLSFVLVAHAQYVMFFLGSGVIAIMLSVLIFSMIGFGPAAVLEMLSNSGLRKDNYLIDFVRHNKLRITYVIAVTFVLTIIALVGLHLPALAAGSSFVGTFVIWGIVLTVGPLVLPNYIVKFGVSRFSNG